MGDTLDIDQAGVPVARSYIAAYLELIRPRILALVLVGRDREEITVRIAGSEIDNLLEYLKTL